MFGKRYFATRKRLAGIVDSVEKLAGEVGLSLGGFAEHSELLEGMRNPFLIVVCGEVNAGKSTLVNGIFGMELCKSNILPETDRVIWYRHGEKERDEDVTDVLQERYRSFDFLHDFNVVDTPGTNSIVRGHQAITERFLPVADLVLFVFPVSNPWGAATWDFISKMPDEMQSKIACVIQQKDLREPEEVEIIIGHLKELAVQRMVKAPQVYPVSGKAALEAKRRQPFAEREWEESGYPELEQFISRSVNTSPGRRQILRDVRDMTSDALRKIEDHMEACASGVERKAMYLKKVEGEADDAREKYDDEVVQRFVGFGDAYMEESEAGIKVLRKKLSLLPSLRSLFKREDCAMEVEDAIASSVEEALGELASLGSHELEDICEGHWKDAAPRINAQLAIKVAKVFEEEEIGLARAREVFVKKLRRVVRQAVIGVRLRGGLEMKVDERRGVMRRFMAGMLIFLTLGGCLGAFQFHMWAWGLVTVALMVGMAGVVVSISQTQKVLKWFQAKILDGRSTMESEVGRGYREEVRRFFSEYVRRLDLVRNEVAVTKSELEPRMEKWRELFLELKSVEKEL